VNLDDRPERNDRAARQAEQIPPAEEARPPVDARWTRWALAGLLVVTGVGYLWDIGRNGWGNTFYAAAVQAGTHSWTSFFFGSFDWSDYITVDKPPVSLWIMALSGRIFGFSSWTMLAPQALLGVGSVALLHAAVRRVWGAPAGLLAGGLLALTPAAALMFRFNNPDAALTFLLVASAYTLTRALERGRLRWLLATAVLLGAAFLAKSLQAALVVPGLALAYLWCAPVTLGRRVGHLLAAGAVLAVSGLWWPLLVDAIPAGSRPYAGGSTNNSVMELITGFNGLDRITGQESGPGGPGGADRPGGFGGAAGLGRLFNTEFAGFIAWWLPAAAVGLVAGLWLVHRVRRIPRRTDPRLGSLVVWGGWTVVTAAVLSFAGGIVHTYYTVALAPGVAALAGMTLPALWRLRRLFIARAFLAAAGAATAVTAFLLLGRLPGWQPWLAWTVLAVGLVTAVILLMVRPAGDAGAGEAVPGWRSAARRLGTVAGAGALLAAVVVPTVWSVATIGSTHTGSIPTVGPAAARGAFPEMPGRFRRDDRAGRDGGFTSHGPSRAGFPPGGFPPGGARSGPPSGGTPSGMSRGMPGGPGAAEPADAELTALLRAGASGFRWVAAAPGSQTAGPLQLAVDAPVMSVGGFNGGDAPITLDRFKALVAARRIHYFVAGRGFGGGPRGREATASIASWVSSTFTPTTVGSTTVYDLTNPRGSATAP
jgi:4-amino-4-deoxy-L-arabinose transferase-like glycosyltransferase